jgi:hypothetical protein
MGVLLAAEVAAVEPLRFCGSSRGWQAEGLAAAPAAKRWTCCWLLWMHRRNLKVLAVLMCQRGTGTNAGVGCW